MQALDMFLDNGVWVLVSVLYPKREPRRYIQMRVRVGGEEEGDIRKLETKGVCLCVESAEFLVVEDRVVDCEWCFVPVALHRSGGGGGSGSGHVG